MAQNTFADFDAVSSNNSTIEGDATDGSVSVAENNLPSTVNNAIRTIMAACNLAFGDLPSGTSRPAYLTAGKFWKDTTTAATPIIKFYDGTDDITVFTIDTTANTVTFAGVLTDDATATLTNKTIDLASNTLTGTLAEFNTAVSDATLAILGANTFTGTQQFDAPITTPPETLTSSTGIALSMTGKSWKRLVLDHNTTITVSGEVANQQVEVWIVQGSTGGTAAWSGVDKWVGGSAPTLSTTAGEIDIIILSADSDGSTIIGEHIGVAS